MAHLLSTAEVYTFTPSDTPDRVRHITGKFVMKTTTEPSLTFNISAESPAGFISSGSIEVNIDGINNIEYSIRHQKFYHYRTAEGSSHCQGPS